MVAVSLGFLVSCKKGGNRGARYDCINKMYLFRGE